MVLAAQIILGLVGTFILVAGLGAVLAPDRVLERYALSASGAEGLSNVRAFFGASVVAIGASVLIAAGTATIEHARPAVLFVIGLVIARLLGYFVDGGFPRFAVYLTIPVVVLGLLGTAHALMS